MKAGKSQEAKGKSMSRRVCGVVLCAVLFALSSGAEAQPVKKVYRVGYISSGAGGAMEAGIRQAVPDLGYVEGQNLVIESRSFGVEADGLPGIIGELVPMKVDAIIVGGTQVAVAAKKAIQTIPIIFAIAGNPVESGVVASLANPGGNLTGVTDIAGELGGKRIELLKESIPNQRYPALPF